MLEKFVLVLYFLQNKKRGKTRRGPQEIISPRYVKTKCGKEEKHVGGYLVRPRRNDITQMLACVIRFFSAIREGF